MVTKKETETKDLIANLTDDMSEVQVLPSPLKRTLVWGSVSIILTLVVTLYLKHIYKGLSIPDMPLFGFHSGNDHQPLSILECCSFTLVGFLCLFACFRLSIPDIKYGKTPFILLGGSTLFLLLATIAAYTMSDASTIHDQLQHSDSYLCIEGLGVVIALPALILYALLKKTAPTLPAWVGYAALLSVVSFGTLALRYLCSDETYAHLLLHHFAPALIVSFFGLLIGKLFLRW